MSLVLHQFRYDQKAFWRNPASVFFTVMFPVVVFVILAVVFNGSTVHVRGGVKATAYYVPAIMTLSIISATMQTLAMTLVIAREDGRLKPGMPVIEMTSGNMGSGLAVACGPILVSRFSCWSQPLRCGPGRARAPRRAPSSTQPRRSRVTTTAGCASPTRLAGMP